MKFSRLAIALPICCLLTHFGFKVAVAALSARRRRSHPNDIAASKEKEGIISNKEDFISQLFDDILISIIARVGTKDSVRTSILSKRWRNLYKFVRDILLDYDRLVGPTLFPCDSNMVIDGVDRFLRLRSGFKIRILHLTCCLRKLSTNRFEQFIYSLGRLGIEKLVLCCPLLWSWHNPSDLSFSCHLLSQMPSLKYFDLAYCYLHQRPPLKPFNLGLCSLDQMPPLKLSSSNNSLQILRLSGVNVGVGALECILANCSSLHSLSIDACKSSSKLFFRGPNLQLKSLWISGCTGVEEIELYASNLITFELRNSEMPNFIFDHVPKLQSIYLNFDNKNTMSYVCTKLVKDLPHLKSFIFIIKGDIYQVSTRTMGFNTFGNLRQLSLRLHSTNNVNLLSLAQILQRCPLLQEFHLDTEFWEYDDGRRLPFVVIHSELKKVEITGHGGTKNEIEFALYILKSAICLEHMHISRCPKWYWGSGRWMGRGKHPWSKKTLDLIGRQLQGQAISNKARLTIEHEPIYEQNWQAYHDASFGNYFFG